MMTEVKIEVSFDSEELDKLCQDGGQSMLTLCTLAHGMAEEPEMQQQVLTISLDRTDTKRPKAQIQVKGEAAKGTTLDKVPKKKM